MNRKIKASKAILRDNFWELTNVKILDNNLRPEIIKTDNNQTTCVPTSLTNEQITDSFADPRVISIYSINNLFQD